MVVERDVLGAIVEQDVMYKCGDQDGYLKFNRTTSCMLFSARSATENVPKLGIHIKAIIMNTPVLIKMLRYLDHWMRNVVDKMAAALRAENSNNRTIGALYIGRR